jgi:FlaG/FlaF family flagellin (archaellin)
LVLRLGKISVVEQDEDMSRLVGAVILMVAVALSSACSGHSHLVGSVTQLSPTLCVGRPAALGDCFTGADASTLSSLRVGDCVAVDFTRTNGEGPASLTNVARVPASSHRDDCPSG